MSGKGVIERILPFGTAVAVALLFNIQTGHKSKTRRLRTGLHTDFNFFHTKPS